MRYLTAALPFRRSRFTFFLPLLKVRPYSLVRAWVMRADLRKPWSPVMALPSLSTRL
ncbi:hypothetical protein [Parabacteroides distasonis]|uniref:hypothetical protein n=1 Tax=Parabacteroides distasonis TaxID=823 RepID=UPI003A952173